MRFISLAFGAMVLAACSQTPSLPEAADPAADRQLAVPELPEQAGLLQLLEYARAEHPKITRARAEYRQARAQYKDSGTLADPQLGLSLGLNDSDWQTLSLSQEVPTFNRRSLTMAQAKANYQAARSGLAAASLAVQTQVLETYAEYAYVFAARQVYEQQQVLLAQLQDVAERRYATGQAPMSELLRSQNEHDQNRIELANLQDLTAASGARLNVALGRPGEASLPAAGALPELVAEIAQLPGNTTELSDLLRDENPNLQQARYQLVALARQQQLAEREALPRFMLGVEYMDMPMSSGILAGMATVSLPVWRSGYQARREAAAAGVAAGQAELAQLDQELSAQLSMSLYRWQEAERNQELYGQTLRERSSQAVSSALTAYQTGQGDFTGLLDTQREWLGFSLTYYRALADQLRTYGELLELLGLPLAAPTPDGMSRVLQPTNFHQPETTSAPLIKAIAGGLQ